MICLVGFFAGEDKIYVIDDFGKVVKKYLVIKNLVVCVLIKIVFSYFLKVVIGIMVMEF